MITAVIDEKLLDRTRLERPERCRDRRLACGHGTHEGLG
jgi:hypothetical protein